MGARATRPRGSTCEQSRRDPGAGSAHFVPRSLLCFTLGPGGDFAVLLDPTIDVDASVGFSQRDEAAVGSRDEHGEISGHVGCSVFKE